VEFCGRVSAAELRELYACSRALIVPGEEDFGITMVEALASGKPVLALGRGGACEIVCQDDLRAGTLYANPTEDDLEKALTRFEMAESEFHPKPLQRWTTQFSEACFRANMQRILSEAPQALAASDPLAEAVPMPFAQRSNR
jgi:glycosyltransferase involved in cell wall biosynthesis